MKMSTNSHTRSRQHNFGSSCSYHSWSFSITILKKPVDSQATVQAIVTQTMLAVQNMNENNKFGYWLYGCRGLGANPVRGNHPQCACSWLQ